MWGSNIIFIIYIYCIFIEKELVLEIERLKRRNGPLKKAKIPSKLDAFIRSIEEERDYYRGLVDSLEKLVRGDPPRAHTPVRSRPSSRTGSPVRSASSPVRETSSSKVNKKVNKISPLTKFILKIIIVILFKGKNIRIIHFQI